MLKPKLTLPVLDAFNATWIQKKNYSRGKKVPRVLFFLTNKKEKERNRKQNNSYNNITCAEIKTA
jgi:hypothetical protein